MPTGQEANGTDHGSVDITHQHSTIDRHCTSPTFLVVQYNVLRDSVHAIDCGCDVLDAFVSCRKKQVISQRFNSTRVSRASSNSVRF